MEEENSRLRAENAAIKEHAKGLEERTKALEEKVQQMERTTELLKTTQQSYAACRATFVKNAMEVNQFAQLGLTWTDSDSKNATKMWADFSKIKMEGDGSSEHEHVHPYVWECLKLILNHQSFGGALGIHHEAHFTFPEFKIDFVITGSHIAKATYPSSLVVIECKKLRNKPSAEGSSSKKKIKLDDDEDLAKLTTQGEGQSISYLSAAVNALDDVSKEELKYRIGIYTNGAEISFFRTDVDLKHRFFTALMKLGYPSGDYPAEPSDGFKWLYKVLSDVSKTVHSTYEMINDHIYPIAIQYQNLVVRVFAVKKTPLELRLIKKMMSTKDKHLPNIVQYEYSVYKKLASSGMKLLQIDEELTEVSDEGVLALYPVGTTLLEEYFIAQDTNTMDQFKHLIVGTIHELEMMHKFGWAHGDVRPANVIVIKNGPATTVRLIDFQTSFEFKSSFRFFACKRSVYSPNYMWLASENDDYADYSQYTAKEEMESLAYGILSLSKQFRAEATASPDHFVDCRASAVNSILDGKWPDPGRILFGGAKILDLLKVQGPVNYDSIRALFSGPI